MGKIWDKYAGEVKAKSMAYGILSLLDHCYARGVKDACNSKDEMMCREFIELTDKPGNFGFLWKDRDSRFDMNIWSARQFVTELMSITIIDSINGQKKIFEYLSKIISPSVYHFCLLHVAQEFYKQGMLDYLKHPNPTKLYTITERPSNKIWTKKGGVGKDKRFTLFRLQSACFDRALRCEEALENGESSKYATKRHTFINFQRSLWAAMNGNEQIINDKELRGRPRKEVVEEDIEEEASDNGEYTC